MNEFIVFSFGFNAITLLNFRFQDPTGTIDASIHRRVLTEGELGKDLSVGAVLILHKVSLA